MLVDFHSHTFESDGTYSPAELTAAMKARGVSVFSVTDHDTLAAYESLGDDHVAPAKLVTGVEINTTYHGNEVHILGYGFPLGAPKLGAIIETNRRARAARAEKMLELLQRAGYEITPEQVRAEAGARAALGRPHVAKALVRAGMVKDVDAAFRTLLSNGKPGYVPSHHIRPHDAVAAIAHSGGVPVLAHPGRLRDETLIDELVEAGVVGLEVFYPTHSPSQVAHFREAATRYGLVMTAGSDFHDPRYNVAGVGRDVESADIAPFLDLVL